MSNSRVSVSTNQPQAINKNTLLLSLELVGMVNTWEILDALSEFRKLGAVSENIILSEVVVHSNAIIKKDLIYYLANSDMELRSVTFQDGYDVSIADNYTMVIYALNCGSGIKLGEVTALDPERLYQYQHKNLRLMVPPVSKKRELEVSHISSMKYINFEHQTNIKLFTISELPSEVDKERNIYQRLIPDVNSNLQGHFKIDNDYYISFPAFACLLFNKRDISYLDRCVKEKSEKMINDIPLPGNNTMEIRLGNLQVYFRLVEICGYKELVIDRLNINNRVTELSMLLPKEETKRYSDMVVLYQLQYREEGLIKL